MTREGPSIWPPPLCLEAAREIERTAAMLREAKAEIIRLRDAKRRQPSGRAPLPALTTLFSPARALARSTSLPQRAPKPQDGRTG
jgi:hypothetical protein